MRLGFDHLSGRGWSGERGLLLISPLEGEMPGRAEGGKPHPPTTRYHTQPPEDAPALLFIPRRTESILIPL